VSSIDFLTFCHLVVNISSLAPDYIDLIMIVLALIAYIFILFWLFLLPHSRDVASVLTSRSRGAVVPRLGLVSELLRLGLVSLSSFEGLGLGLQGLGFASRSRLKRPRAHPCHVEHDPTSINRGKLLNARAAVACILA